MTDTDKLLHLELEVRKVSMVYEDSGHRIVEVTASRPRCKLTWAQDPESAPAVGSNVELIVRRKP